MRRIVFSASGICSRWIDSLAVPITVDSVNAPASIPAAVPISKFISLPIRNAVSKHVTQITSVSIIEELHLSLSLEKIEDQLCNQFNRNKSKKITLTTGAISI